MKRHVLGSLRCLCAFLTACLAATTFASARESWSPTLERDSIWFNMIMPADTSIREQYLYQSILAKLLWKSAWRIPEMQPCAWKVRLEIEFGALFIEAGHRGPSRRLACLRAGANYLLHQTISESEFLVARAAVAEFVATFDEPNPTSRPFDRFAVHNSAMLAVYQKGSTLHQLYSIGSNDVRAIPFAEFEGWLRRSREKGMTSFAGNREILELLDVPDWDPMVLRPIASLESSRVPAGVVPFEGGDRFGIPAMILLKQDHDTPDDGLRHRLGCNLGEPLRLGGDGAGKAIAAIFCDTFTMFNDEAWAFFSIRKVNGASDQDFCRQVQELAEDADIAALVRIGPEGKKGLYILLPPQCGQH